MKSTNYQSPRGSGEDATAQMQVRVKPSEKALWEAQAKREGMSLSNWVKRTLNAKVT